MCVLPPDLVLLSFRDEMKEGRRRKAGGSAREQRRQEMMNWNKGGSREGLRHDDEARKGEPETQDELGDRILASDPL